MTDPADTERPWDRQPTDTPKSWEAYVLYRDAGPTRQLIDVAARLTKSVQLISRWSIQHGWRERVAAFDKEQDRLWQEQVAGERHLVAKRHVRVLQGIQAKGVEALNQVTVTKMSPRDVLAFLIESIRAEGALYGIGEDADHGPQGGVTVIIDPGMVPGPTVTPEDLSGS